MAPSPLAIVNVTNQRLRNSKFGNTPTSSAKAQSSNSTDRGDYFDCEVKNISASSGTICGSGTLEVLFEDPQEDSYSLNFENETKRLISDDDSDVAFSMSNLDCDEQTDTAWKLLEEEISEIIMLLRQFSSQPVYYSTNE